MATHSSLSPVEDGLAANQTETKLAMYSSQDLENSSVHKDDVNQTQRKMATHSSLSPIEHGLAGNQTETKMAMYSSQDLQNSSVHKDDAAAAAVGAVVKKRKALNNNILEGQQPSKKQELEAQQLSKKQELEAQRQLSKKQETVTPIKQPVIPESELIPLRKLDLAEAEHEFYSRHSPFCYHFRNWTLPDSDLSSSDDEGPPHRFDVPRTFSAMRQRGFTG